MTLPSVAPHQGFGLGLRVPHYDDFLSGTVPVDFLEIISENFMVDGGRPLHILDRIRERLPIAMHGVSMSLGSADGLRLDYLQRLKTLADRVEPLWISDHLCWTSIENFNSHDLLPLPYTEEALEIVCRNVAFAQDVLERPILVENASTYVTFAANQLSEWEFISELCLRTGCYLLLDINNVYVNSRNHAFDPWDFISGVPAERVLEFHLAGHSQGRACLIDTHDNDVPDAVWTLYEKATERCPHAATLIERDDNIPALATLLAELDKARRLCAASQLQSA